MAEQTVMQGPGAPTGDKGLKSGALGLLSSVVIGVASTAPGYSLAAVLGILVASVGLQAPAIMILAFIPMLFIAAAYYYMNRANPDCGTKMFAHIDPRYLTPSTSLYMGLAPLAGGLILTWVFFISAIDLADPANSESGDSWFGLGPPLVIGIGFLLLGVIFMFLQQPSSPGFFRRKPEVARSTHA